MCALSSVAHAVSPPSQHAAQIHINLGGGMEVKPEFFSMETSTSVSAPTSCYSIVKHPYDLLPGSNVAPPSATNNVFAVIAFSGTQYKITQVQYLSYLRLLWHAQSAYDTAVG
jgi:hypothetical protein